MKPAPFKYHAPRSKHEALQLLADNRDACLLAGGQSLMPMLNFRMLAPAHLIDLNRIAQLTGITSIDGKLRIGAMTRQCDLACDAVISSELPLLQDALAHVGHVQTRNRGTLGGSLCHLDPSAELVTAAAALDATLIAESAADTRRIPFREWCAGPLTHTLRAGEMLVAVELSSWPRRHGHAFVEYARRKGDFAIVGVAALLVVNARNIITRAAVAIGGCAPAPQRPAALEQALLGRPATADTFKAAARLASTIEAHADAYVKADYRRHLARVLTERALTAAAQSCQRSAHA